MRRPFGPPGPPRALEGHNPSSTFSQCQSVHCTLWLASLLSVSFCRAIHHHIRAIHHSRVGQRASSMLPVGQDFRHARDFLHLRRPLPSHPPQNCEAGDKQGLAPGIQRHCACHPSYCHHPLVPLHARPRGVVRREARCAGAAPSTLAPAQAPSLWAWATTSERHRSTASVMPI